jgi:hypothetical protein
LNGAEVAAVLDYDIVEHYEKSEGATLFAPGDIVYLKSGSWPMTVLEQEGETVKVCWAGTVRIDGMQGSMLNTDDVPSIALTLNNPALKPALNQALRGESS